MKYAKLEESAEYKEFVDKFKSKKTTDDCYTPSLVYEAVKDWACKEYEINPGKIIRPFYPGGDYESYDYPEDCVVLDNPPFSILGEIINFYLEHEIAFFLFAPALTAFSKSRTVMKCNHILPGAQITYENGARVSTGFVTSFGGDTVAQTAPELRQAIEEAGKKSKAAEKAAAEKAAAEKAAAEKAAAEKAAAEKAAAEKWSISDRERELIAAL